MFQLRRGPEGRVYLDAYGTPIAFNGQASLAPPDFSSWPVVALTGCVADWREWGYTYDSSLVTIRPGWAVYVHFIYTPRQVCLAHPIRRD